MSLLFVSFVERSSDFSKADVLDIVAILGFPSACAQKPTAKPIIQIDHCYIVYESTTEYYYRTKPRDKAVSLAMQLNLLSSSCSGRSIDRSIH
jgi:hypothetical protein